LTCLQALVYDRRSMSVTLTEATKRVYETFITDWAALTPFVFDNENLTPPNPNNDWVRVVVRHAGGGQESLGDVGRRKFNRRASVFVQCFTPENKGRAAADVLVTAARNIFEGKTLLPESIHFTDSDVREIGVSKGYYQMNMEAFINYTETK